MGILDKKPKKRVIDPFAKERALLKAMNVKDKGESDRLEAFERMLEERGFTRMPHPQKGTDYWTDEDIAEMKAQVLAEIIVPEAEKVDYELIGEYISNEISEYIKKIPVPKKGDKGDPGEKGDPGKDAVVNIEDLVNKVLKKMPKAKEVKSLTLKEVKEYVDEELRKNHSNQPVRIGGSVASLRAMTDVDISRMPMDSQGNYIFNRYNLTVSDTAPNNPQENDLWVDIS